MTALALAFDNQPPGYDVDEALKNVLFIHQCLATDTELVGLGTTPCRTHSTSGTRQRPVGGFRRCGGFEARRPRFFV